MAFAALISALDPCRLAFQDPGSTQQWLSRLVPRWTFKSGSKLAHVSYTVLLSWIPSVLASVPASCLLTSATIPHGCPLTHGALSLVCLPLSPGTLPNNDPSLVLPEAGSELLSALPNPAPDTTQLVVYTIVAR